jgi:hypothetical protein
MVVLAAAAAGIAAGSIAVYKGGEATVKATTKCITSKIRLSNKEKDRQKVLRLRKEERVERFAKVNEYRNSFNNKN